MKWELTTRANTQLYNWTSKEGGVNTVNRYFRGQNKAPLTIESANWLRHYLPWFIVSKAVSLLVALEGAGNVWAYSSCLDFGVAGEHVGQQRLVLFHKHGSWESWGITLASWGSSWYTFSVTSGNLIKIVTWQDYWLCYHTDWVESQLWPRLSYDYRQAT